MHRWECKPPLYIPPLTRTWRKQKLSHRESITGWRVRYMERGKEEASLGGWLFFFPLPPFNWAWHREWARSVVKSCSFHLTRTTQQSSQRGDDVRGLKRPLRIETARLGLHIHRGGVKIKQPSWHRARPVKCRLLLLGLKYATAVSHLGEQLLLLCGSSF